VREFHHFGGILIGACFTGSFGYVVFLLLEKPRVAFAFIFCGMAAPLIANAVIKGENAMIRNILKALGITELNMKLEALAKHFKLKFVHVPEHFKCESTE
jgi:hypothetical protein